MASSLSLTISPDALVDRRELNVNDLPFREPLETTEWSMDREDDAPEGFRLWLFAFVDPKGDETPIASPLFCLDDGHESRCCGGFPLAEGGDASSQDWCGGSRDFAAAGDEDDEDRDRLNASFKESILNMSSSLLHCVSTMFHFVLCP